MATDILTRGAQGRELTGRMVLIWLVGFFAVVGAVNAVMIGAAISTFAGLEHDSPYQAGLAFDQEIAAARAAGGAALAGPGQGGQVGRGRNAGRDFGA